MYAKKGDELTVIRKSIDVWIVEDSKGNRFGCHLDKLSVTPPEPDAPIEVIKPIDLFNQI